MVFDHFLRNLSLITMIARTSDIAHDHLSTKSTDLGKNLGLNKRMVKF